MRITILTWRDKWHPKAGGSEEYIYRLAEDLAKKGHIVTFLSAKYPGAIDQIERGVIYKHVGNSYTQYVSIPLYFLTHLKKTTDVLIENFNAWPFLSPLLHKNNITIIHHLQDVEWENTFGPILGKILTSLSRIVLSFYKSQNIITVSPSTQDELYLHGFTRNKVTLIYNGIDDMFFASPANKEITKKENVNILFLGRIAKGKRFPYAMELLSKYTQNHSTPKITIHVLGEGEDRPVLETMAKELSLETKFYGRAPDQEKLKVVNTSDLHIQFALKEGWAITVIEAASRGVPTVCLHVPGLKDSVLPSTGYIAENDAELYTVLETAIDQCASNAADYQSKSIECIRFSKQFSWAYSLEKISALIEQLFPTH